MKSLGIAIDGGRYLRIDSRTGDFPRRIRLRTLSPGQDSARLDFCRFTRRGPRILASHRITGLGGSDAPSEFRLTAERRHFAVWEVRIAGRKGPEGFLRIRSGIGLWPFILSGLILAVVIVFLVFQLMTRMESSGMGAAESPAKPPVEQAVVSEADSEGTPGKPDGVEEPAAVTGVEPDTPVPEPGPGHESSLDPEHGSRPEPEPVSGPEPGLDPGPGSRPEPESGPEPVPETEPEPVVVLPAPVTIYFQPESAVLDYAARNALDELAEEIPEQCLLIITGHSAEYGTERGRLKLSELRARQVAEYLASGLGSGVEIRMIGRGGQDPVTEDPKRQYLNRRVDIVVTETGR